MHQLRAWPASQVHKLSTLKCHKLKCMLWALLLTVNGSRSEQNAVTLDIPSYRRTGPATDSLLSQLADKSFFASCMSICVFALNVYASCMKYLLHFLWEHTITPACTYSMQHLSAVSTDTLKNCLIPLLKIGEINCSNIILYTVFDKKWQEVLLISTLALFGVVNIALPEALCGWHLCYT